jgi:hypothetical protein
MQKENHCPSRGRCDAAQPQREDRRTKKKGNGTTATATARRCFRGSGSLFLKIRQKIHYFYNLVGTIFQSFIVGLKTFSKTIRHDGWGVHYFATGDQQWCVMTQNYSTIGCRVH